MITYTTFSPTLVDTYFDSYLKTIENLVPAGKQNPENMKNNLEKMLNQWSQVFIAIDKEVNEIVGTITILIEQKLTRWWAKAWHIEEVITRKWWGRRWIASSLITQAIEYAKKQWCYKIILDCDKKLIPFYEKFWFQESEVMMKMYM